MRARPTFLAAAPLPENVIAHLLSYQNHTQLTQSTHQTCFLGVKKLITLEIEAYKPETWVERLNFGAKEEEKETKQSKMLKNKKKKK